MKTSKRNKLLGLALTGSFSLFNASNAFSAAGDPVSNTATLGYTVGGNVQTVIESSEAGNSAPGVGAGTATTFLEDRIINFTVTRENGLAVPVVPGGTQQAIPYLVDNTGNGTHGFLLAGVHNSGALDPFGSAVNDDLTPTTIQTFVDVNDNATFEPAIDNVAFIASMTPAVAAVRVFVISDIPLVDDALNPLVNGDIAVMSLVAHATNGVSTGIATDAIVRDDNNHVSTGGVFTNGAADVTPLLLAGVNNPDTTGGMETVFNDDVFTDPVTGITIDATGANDVAQNAQHSSYSSYTVQSASLTVTKTSAPLWDIVNLDSFPKAIPGGSVIRYTITVTNAAGAADASLTSIVDDLPLSIDAQFGDGTAANGPVSGANNVFVTDALGAPAFCQADPGDTTPADGCDSALGGVAGRLSVDLTAVAGITNVLQAGQTLTIMFDVVLP
jgi:hypothetical protein